MSKNLSIIAGVIAATLAAGAAHANTVDDTSLVMPPGFYNGSGNANAGFIVTTNNGAEIAVGATLRKQPNSVVHPASGTSNYQVPTGYYSFTNDFCNGTCAIWNIPFSVNVSGAGLHLSDITTTLTIENLTTLATSSFNPLTTFTDNAGSDGVNPKNVANTNLATDIGFQNSENLAFSEFAALNFDPLESTAYLVTFNVFHGASELASVQETINATPIPAALPLFVSGLGALGFVAHRRKRKQVVKI